MGNERWHKVESLLPCIRILISYETPQSSKVWSTMCELPLYINQGLRIEIR